MIPVSLYQIFYRQIPGIFLVHRTVQRFTRCDGHIYVAVSVGNICTSTCKLDNISILLSPKKEAFSKYPCKVIAIQCASLNSPSF